MSKNKRKMWQTPWRYKECVAFVSGITIIGFLLQLMVGRFEIEYFNFPINIIAAGGLVLLIILCSLNRKNAILRWFSGIPFSVTLIAFLLFFCIIMGLTPQLNKVSHHQRDIFTLLGFRQMTSAWHFVLIYCFTLFSLGCLIVRRLIDFRKEDYAFYLNHIGLWLLLLFSAIGATDMRRYVMHVVEGEVEWRVYSENEDVLELPIAIQLNDFDMEEYPPKLAIIDRETGDIQPVERPEFYHIDDKKKKAVIFDWEIECLEYIHQAVRNSDSTYNEVHMPGASPAVKITATDRETGESHTGWVCGGNSAQLYMTLNLDSFYCVVMTKPEPKQFSSDITIFTEDGKEEHTILKVNHPYKIGHWTIYQYGYDNEAGKLSSYSSLELVYDPWIYPAYAGIAILALGSICMLWSGSRKERRVYDVE